MTAEITEGEMSFCRTFLEALNLTESKTPRIAAVGAGGKTTLLKMLAAEYRALGRQPVVITTTHMKNENAPQFLVDPTLEEILEVREREGYVFAGAKAENEKIKRLPSDIMEAVLKLPCPILIEADGARRLPAKLPAEHEPVLLPQVTCVLSVYGLDAVGGKIKEVCFRPERAAEFLHKDTAGTLEPGDVAVLALSGQAGRKGVNTDMQYNVVLHKADSEERKKLALDIWREIEKRKRGCGLQEVKVMVTAKPC